MHKYVLAITIFAMGFSLAVQGDEALSAYTFQQHVLCEMYLSPAENRTPVFGFQFDKTFWENVYYSLTIKGAIGGNGRGGYGNAAFGSGIHTELVPRVTLDTALFFGSGGGGGFDVEGGLFYQVQTGVWFSILPQVTLESYIGYLNYLTGRFQSPIVRIGMAFRDQKPVIHLTQNQKPAPALSPEQFQTQSSRFTLEYKSYFYTPDEILSQYGAKVKNFINENWYWGQAGYGAVGGTRNGYIEGGLLLGYELHPVHPAFNVDINCLIGAAGGGLSKSEGGGFLIQPYLNLGVALNDWTLDTQIGWEHYINGDISSICWGFSIGRKSVTLRL